jgi:hypothetical protein
MSQKGQVATPRALNETSGSDVADLSCKLILSVQPSGELRAVPGNTTQLRVFSRRVAWLWRNELVRRSQRARVGWDRLTPILTQWIPQPRVQHPYPDARFNATHPE